MSEAGQSLDITAPAP